jgi:two-component system, LytTR family, sensor kinase
MSNPFTSNRKVSTIYYPIWFSLFLIQTGLLNYFLKINLIYAAADSVIFNGIYLFIGIGIWYTVRFNSLENYSSKKIMLNHLAGGVLTSAIWILMSYLLITSLLNGDQKYLEFLKSSLIWRFLIGMLLYVVFVAVYYVIIYYNSFQEKLLREAELNASVKEAELNALKYQINPHFIFNSLNSISSLTLSNPKRAQEMTIKLSSFMRSTLAKNEKQKNTLREEINNAQLYLDIEKIRFQDKFEFKNEIAPECGEIEVPGMILQPLMENAIKHGVYESLEKVFIKLYCRQEKEYFIITVENNFDPESVPRKGEGIGLKNIRNRLKLIFNQDNLLKVENTEGIFKVILYIPKMKNE